MAMRTDTTRSRSDKHERRVAAQIGAKVVRGSGSGTEKGDVRNRGVLRIECKTTRAKSFSVTLDMIEKIERAAAGTGELAAIAVQFETADGRMLRECYIVPAEAFE